MAYILNTKTQIKEMLSGLGLASTQELFSHIPEKILLSQPVAIASGLSEQEVSIKMNDLAGKNKPLSGYNSFLGAGCYDHYLPAALFSLLSRSEFYTAYTPYQPECSQGTLQAIYEFQSYICLLTSLDAANASLYDGASALAESVLMALRINRKNKVLISEAVHPNYRKVMATYLKGTGCQIRELAFSSNADSDLNTMKNSLDDTVSCVVVQNPDFFGRLIDLSAWAQSVHEKGALFVSVSDPFSLALLKAPGDQFVDIACGEIQAFGSPVSCGGPGCGFISARSKFLRQMPGRIVGRTADKEGKPGYCLTLQTREQHIRREKATSNICSNQSLNALAAAIYMSLLGRQGLAENALTALNLAHYMQSRLSEIKEVTFPLEGEFFNEFVWALDGAFDLVKKLRRSGCIAGLVLDSYYPEMKNSILSCCTEMTTKKKVDSFIDSLKNIISKK